MEILKNNTKIFPIGKICLLGRDISEYRIVIPENCGEKISKGAAILSDSIYYACGVRLGITTEISGCVIIVGESNSRAEKLTNSGYFIYTEGTRLTIGGKTEKGTLNGVISFLKDHIGYRFLNTDCEICDEKDTLEICGIDESYSPKFDFRCSFYRYVLDDKDYDDLHRLDPLVYAGGRCHTLYELAEMTGEHIGVQPCLTDERVFETVLKNARKKLDEHPEANVISISQNDSYEHQLGCRCDRCMSLNEKYGTEGGALFVFVNRIARELKKDYPDVSVETLAYRYSVVPPANFVFEDNVLVMLCLMDVCYNHTIDTPSCAGNYRFAGFFENWYKVTKRISIWDYHTDFAFYQCIFPNYYMMYDHIGYYAGHGVVSVFNEANHNSKSAQFEELRSYICSEMMWNPYMSREEYMKNVDIFLEGFYGKGWRYIRQAIDLTVETAKANGAHFTLYSRPSDIMQTSLEGSDGVFEKLFELFDKADKATETEAQHLRLEKAWIQIKYTYLYSLPDEKSNPDENKALYDLIAKHGIGMITEVQPITAVSAPENSPNKW